jgi:hypothetical protein
MCKAISGGSICLPGSEIPSVFMPTVGWFCHLTSTSLISFRVPSFWDGKIGKLLLCVVFAANKEAPRGLSRMGSFNWNLRNKTRTHQFPFTVASIADRFLGICEDHIFVQVMGDHQRVGFEMKSGDEIELSVTLVSLSMDRREELMGEIQVKKFLIRLLFDDPNVMDTREEAVLRLRAEIHDLRRRQ